MEPNWTNNLKSHGMATSPSQSQSASATSAPDPEPNPTLLVTHTSPDRGRIGVSRNFGCGVREGKPADIPRGVWPQAEPQLLGDKKTKPTATGGQLQLLITTSDPSRWYSQQAAKYYVQHYRAGWFYRFVISHPGPAPAASPNRRRGDPVSLKL